MVARLEFLEAKVEEQQSKIKSLEEEAAEADGEIAMVSVEEKILVFVLSAALVSFIYFPHSGGIGGK